MNENNYEEYKQNLYRRQKRLDGLRTGRVSILIGIGLILWSVCSLPFHADNASDIRGDELKAGNAYYMEDLQLLHAKVDDTNDKIYCIAKFTDENQKDWILSVNPGNDEHLVKRINLSKSLGKELDIETSGYFYLDDISGNAKIYYSGRSDEYADSDGENVLKLNADYLCGASGNYTLQALLNSSKIKRTLVWGVIGVIFGIGMLFKNRIRKSSRG